ncbi:hypothetical protein NDU88_010465 [Pleurodeles waltl]|uniref:Uncharacterized protein n=1 Tax=Pleurodeles waltl TaxID=8319 RepID=A0AAV7PYF7_PLEWA|nr:hypothetical protein NDU88_010465 [Pleurodeles waltl]
MRRSLWEREGLAWLCLAGGWRHAVAALLIGLGELGPRAPMLVEAPALAEEVGALGGGRIGGRVGPRPPSAPEAPAAPVNLLQGRICAELLGLLCGMLGGPVPLLLGCLSASAWSCGALDLVELQVGLFFFSESPVALEGSCIGRTTAGKYCSPAAFVLNLVGSPK